MQGLCSESRRYEYEIPDYELHPDVYDRTWVLLEWVGTDKHVLELGCSTGFMSRYLTQKRRCSVVGIELDAAAAAQAKDFCEEVLVRDLNRQDWFADLPREAFDVVLMGDVLEHLVYPPTLLTQLRPLLSSDARLVISLPNVVHWITRLEILFGRFNYESSGVLDHTHLRFFTPKTAREMIEGSGYRIDKFHPAFGGRMSGHARPVWQRLANWFPGLFAIQLLFDARPEGISSAAQMAKETDLHR